MMNSPFAIEQAKQLASLCAKERQHDPEDRIRTLYSRIYQRKPTAKEVSMGLKFVQNAQTEPQDTSNPEPSNWLYGYGKYDMASKRVKSFTLLARWTFDVVEQIEKWRLGPEPPDAKLGRLVMTAEGGHPGPDEEHAVIRRFVAPKSGTISIDA